jgi:hypothetical protein
MKKIWVTFSDDAEFVLVDEEQGILRKRCNSDGKQIPLEVEETSFVQNKINERILRKVSEEKTKKVKSPEKEYGRRQAPSLHEPHFSKKPTKSGQDKFLSLRTKPKNSKARSLTYDKNGLAVSSRKTKDKKR